MPLRMLSTKVHMFRHRIWGHLTFSTIQPKVATVGIDFGCKNSRVAIIESLVPRVVASEIGHVTPSYVTLADQKSHSPDEWCMQYLDRVGKQVAVGQIAKYKMLRQPSDVVYNIKSLIGKEFDDPHVQGMRRKVQFSIIKGLKGEALVDINGMEFSPVEISSAIFAKLKRTVQMYQFHHNLQAVISVPAFFSDQQRKDIKLAGNSAGLDVLQVIDEPIAAALSSTTKKGIVVVFGMGAGSYSISILHMSEDNTEVKSQSYDTSVGGDQFDKILLDYFVSQIIELHSVDITGDKYAMTILTEVVEQVKVNLSNQLKVTVSIPWFTSSAEGPVDLNLTMCRPKFEKLVDSLIGQIKNRCHSILKEANITDKDIAEVVLFGGMTRMLKLRSIICEVFGEHQSSRVNPEQAVAIGSAIEAALFVEDRRKMGEDMIPLSIGIKSANGIFTRVIPRNTTLPTKRTVTIPVWCAYGECQHVRIFLGEHAEVHHNLFLGDIELINNRSSHHGSVDFEVTFEVDKDYMVKVSAIAADAQLEAADDMRKAFRTFAIDQNVMSKHNVYKVVRDALLNWPKCVTEIHDPLTYLARYIVDTLDDVLSARKYELPKDLYEDAGNALTDLRGALDADEVLTHKVFTVASMVSAVLNWVPSDNLQSGSEDSDPEN